MSEPSSLAGYMNKYYKQRMERLYSKSYNRTIDGGRNAVIRFTSKGNNHLIHDTYGYRKILQKIDLPNIDKLFEDSDYVASAPLFKSRNDNIVRFHYFKVRNGLHGSTAYINVAEAEDGTRRKDGSIQTRTSFYVYSVVPRLVIKKKPRI